MPAHKKTPAFIRIITSEKEVVCINALELSTFQILEKHKIQTKGAKDSKDPTDFLFADTLKFYFPTGTGLSYSVGVNITQQDFNYICATLLEFVYLNETEFNTRHAALQESKMDEWNKLSQENEAKIVTPPTAT